MDKKTQKIIDKCYILMKKGYTLQYCQKRFKAYRQDIGDYFLTAENIGSLKKIQPASEFIESSLSSIYARAEKDKKPLRKTASSPAAFRKRLILRQAMIFLLLVILSIFSFAGTLFASQDSLPGEVLYPLKRSFEDFRLNISTQNQKGNLHLQFLNNRIHEAEALLAYEDDADEVLVQGLIVEMDKQYQFCRQYNCIDPAYGQELLDSIGSVKNRYQNRFGKNPEKEDQDKSIQNQESLDSNDQKNEEHDSGKKNKDGKNGSGNNKK